jgi:hypothetical protein
VNRWLGSAEFSKNGAFRYSISYSLPPQASFLVSFQPFEMPATVPHLVFSNGENPGLLADTEEKALLPLKKGGREEFLGKVFSNC